MLFDEDDCAILAGRNLIEEELTYFAELIVFYVGVKLPGIQEQGLRISRSGSSSN